MLWAISKSTQRLTLMLAVGCGCFCSMPAADAATLAVNFSQSLGPSQSGFTNWETPDNTATQVTTTISGIGLTFDPVVSDVSTNNGFRSINRGGNDGYVGTMASLTQTWWGVRASSTGGGGQFVIIISGSDLGAGTFQWTSWHHDQENQTGPMDIEYSVNSGSSWTLAFDNFDIVDKNTNLNVGAPNPASFSFTANGTQNVHVRFTNAKIGTSGSNDPFALINGFQIVPEPSSALLCCMGVLLMMRRRR